MICVWRNDGRGDEIFVWKCVDVVIGEVRWLIKMIEEGMVRSVI